MPLCDEVRKEDGVLLALGVPVFSSSSETMWLDLQGMQEEHGLQPDLVPDLPPWKVNVVVLPSAPAENH